MRMKGTGPSKKKKWPIVDLHVPSNDPRTHFGLPHAYSLTRIVYGRLAQILFILIGYLHATAVVPWKLQRLLLSFHKIPFNTGSDITAVPREIEKNAHAKFFGENKVHYGKCGSGECNCSLKPRSRFIALSGMRD